MIIDSQMIIEKSNDVIVSNMGTEKVMLSIANGKYYNLGELGGDIWGLLNEPKSANQLTSELIKIYDIDEVQCKEDVLAFLQHLLKEELIKCS
jgi:hypothetical protein